MYMCIYIYTCVYVCIHVHLHIYTYLYIYTYIHICGCMYVCTHIYIYTHTYTYVGVCMYVHMHAQALAALCTLLRLLCPLPFWAFQELGRRHLRGSAPAAAPAKWTSSVKGSSLPRPTSRALEDEQLPWLRKPLFGMYSCHGRLNERIMMKASPMTWYIYIYTCIPAHVAEVKFLNSSLAKWWMSTLSWARPQGTGTHVEEHRAG